MLDKFSLSRNFLLVILLAVVAACQTVPRSGFTAEQIATLTAEGFENVGENYELGLENRVLFAFDSDVVTSDTARMLGGLSAKLAAVGIHGAIVEGHTDDVGEEDYNQALSEKRAIAVKNALVFGGFRETDVMAHGLGEADPIESNATEEGRQENRRVVIVITPTHALPL